MTNSKKEKIRQHTRMRFNNIIKKVGHGLDAEDHIFLRTSKMKNLNKLFCWIELLKNEGYKEQAKLAKERIGELYAT